MVEQHLGDFVRLWSYIHDHHGYSHRKQTDWEQVRTLYRPSTAQVTSRRQLVGLLEDVLGELYDPHPGGIPGRRDQRQDEPRNRPFSSRKRRRPPGRSRSG